ncbi:MAG: DUF2085 domain-containing protein [Anaerolineales bacterium]|nr:DUF2085 domain-containing protein [Anaerolineales bacterium]
MEETATNTAPKTHPQLKRAGKGLLIVAVALVLFGWLLNTPPGLLGKADAIGYAVCHQIDVRSFHLGDRPISLCARCTGMYLGALVGLLYQFLRGRRRGTPPIWMMVVFGVFIAAFGVDGTNSYLKLLLGSSPLYEPNNILRLITGTGMGLTISAALYPAYQGTVWRRSSPRPALETWKDLLGLLGLSAIVILLVLSENPLILYPLALLSAGTVLLILTIVYGMLWMFIFRVENTLEKPTQLVWPLLGGLLIGLMQIGLIDLGRYLLTGTWEGFHIFLG